MIEILELSTVTRRHKRFPWLVPGEMGFWTYLYCALTRPLVGVVVAVALGATGQVSGAWGLLVIGAGAPLIIRNAAQQVAGGQEIVSVEDAAAPADSVPAIGEEEPSQPPTEMESGRTEAEN